MRLSGGCSGVPQRSQSRALARGVIAILLALVAGCAELRPEASPPVSSFRGSTVPCCSRERLRKLVAVWVSTANPELSNELLDDLARVVLPEAQRRKAALQVFRMPTTPGSRPELLGSAEFSGATNPTVRDRANRTATQALVDRLQGLPDEPPASAEDTVGALSAMADLFAQVDRPEHNALGVLLGGGIPSTDSCNLTLLPVGNDRLDATARECLAPYRIVLGGAPVWLDGVGVDPTRGGLPPERIQGARRALVRMIEQAGGRPCRSGASLAAGARQC